MDLIYPIFTLMCMIIVILSLLFNYSKNGDVFNPWVVMTALSLLDVYIPAILRLSSEELNFYPSWMVHLDQNDLIYGMLAYFFGWVFFSLGYFTFKKVKMPQSTYYRIINLTRVKFLLSISLVIFLVYIYFTLNFFGGVSNYLMVSLSERFNSTIQLPGYLSILGQLKIVAMSLIFISSTLIFNSNTIKDNYPKARFLLILVCIAVASTTLFRGTILNFFLGFGAITVYILEKKGKNNVAIKSFSKKIVITSVSLFIVVGAARSLYIATNVSEEESAAFSIVREVNKNLTGSSLIGVSSIVKYYGEDSERLFFGKTIIDMLLMPVPRAIYPSKPEWYGIDDITRRMGWPESTQSATSTQGELIANFGYIGLIFMSVFGALFGTFYKWSKANIVNASIYSFIVVPAILTTFWMSTTGLINALKFLPFVYIILLLISSRWYPR